MPVYCESVKVSEGDSSLEFHVFDYCNPNVKEEKSPEKKCNKQLISLYPCMFLGTRNMTQLDDSGREVALRKGQVFEGYFVRTKNGTYDYCYKIWTDRRLPFPPLNYPIPKEDEVNDVILIDRNNDYCGLACGPHLSFCKASTLEEVTGMNLTNISYPKGGIKAKLRKVQENRPPEIPYAAFEAIPINPQSIESTPIKSEPIEPDTVKLNSSEASPVKTEVKEEAQLENGMDNTVSERN